MLQTRKVFRAGFVLLPLAVFLHVSLTNNVLGPDLIQPETVSGTRQVFNKESLVASDQETSEQFRSALSQPEEQPVIKVTDSSASVTVAQLEIARWVAEINSSAEISSLTLPPVGAGNATAVSRNDESEAITTASTLTHRSDRTTNTYVVNEGGSLWRTGRRFIDDEVLLDKLIDSLEESGMNVRSVSPGVEFVVNDLGSKGLFVVVEDRGEKYESLIVKNSISSSVRRPTAAAGEDDVSHTALLKP